MNVERVPGELWTWSSDERTWIYITLGPAQAAGLTLCIVKCPLNELGLLELLGSAWFNGNGTGRAKRLA